MSEPVKRVLVVDDNRYVRQTLPYVLENEGYAVQIAENGEEAFRAACREPFDLVLTDISMPDVGGVDLIRLMRQDPFFRQTPIVAMSAFGSQRLLEAKAAGANACLEKPLRHEELLRLVARLVRAR
jgi:CheY-like chemotaxis protein